MQVRPLTGNLHILRVNVVSLHFFVKGSIRILVVIHQIRQQLMIPESVQPVLVRNEEVICTKIGPGHHISHFPGIRIGL
ncbi:hypothetical protein D3C81_1309200 [compost metagenome]